MNQIVEMKKRYNPWKLEPGQMPPEPTNELMRLAYRQMIWKWGLQMMSRRYETKPDWPFWKVYDEHGCHVETVRSPTPGGAVSQFAWNKMYCRGRDRVFIVNTKEATLETKVGTFLFIKVT